MRKLTGYFLILTTFLIIRVPDWYPDYSISTPGEQGSIGTQEDPNARHNYEHQLLADPKTGVISVNRKAELSFAKTLPNKSDDTNQLRTTQTTFRKAGPYNIGGRTRAAAFDIRDEKTLLAGGVSGNIWKTTNSGVSWTRSSTPNIRNSVTTLAQDTRSGMQDTWYFGTGELLGNSARSLVSPYRGSGIYKTTDNGETWSILESTIDNASPDNFTSMFQYVWRMALDPENLDQSVILAATFGGVVRSTDGGEAWSTVLGEPLINLGVEDLNCADAPFYTEIHRTSSGIFFASLSSVSAANRSGVCKNDTRYSRAGYYYSVNGINWKEITPGLLPSQHHRTVINSNSSGSEVYFLSDGPQQSFLKFTVNRIIANTIDGTWRSAPSVIPKLGGTYGDFDTQGGYNMMVAVHPNNDQVVYVGGTNLYRSTDGFSTNNNIDWIGGYSPENDASQYEDHHADQHLVLFTPSNPNIMISCSDGGLIKTTNNLAETVSWTSLNNGYVTSQFYSISQRKNSRSNEMIGGMQDNGSWFRNSVGENPPWNRILGGDGGYSAISGESDYRYVSFQNSQIYRTTLNDNYKLTSFARVDPVGGGNDGVPYLFINPYELDPKNENRMFLLGGNVIWRNNNLAQIPGGVQSPTPIGWDKLETTIINDGFYSCISVGVQSDIVYAGISGAQPGLVRINDASDDKALTTVFHRDSLTLPRGGHVASIGINPENSQHIVMVFSNYNVSSIFESFDGGLSFYDISGNLEEFPDGRGNGPSVRWVEIVPTTAGFTYYVGTSIGLYSTNQAQGENTIWEQNDPEEIGHAVIAMMDYRTIDGRLVIATHGSGTFESYLTDAKLFTPTDEISPEFTTSAFPNPFMEQISIAYNLPEDQEVAIGLFDDSGKLVRTLLFAPQYAGKNQITWDGKNNAGVPVKPGIYFAVIYYKGEKYTERLIRLPQ